MASDPVTDRDEFLRLAAGVIEDPEQEADRILREHGPAMLRSMVVWLHDPYEDESPVQTRERWAAFMTGATNRGGHPL